MLNLVAEKVKTIPGIVLTNALLLLWLWSAVLSFESGLTVAVWYTAVFMTGLHIMVLGATGLVVLYVLHRREREDGKNT
jgi:hypothetical protein